MSEKLRVIRQLCENWCYHDGKPADVIGEVLAVLDGVDEAPSDPKHLPPRDCLVLYQDSVDKRTGTEPYLIQANFQESDGEHDDRWVFPYSREIVDLESVITWRELPEVE